MSKLGISFPLTSDYKGSVEYTPSIVRSIEDSLKQILLTNRGERPMNPSFGCDLRKIVFEDDLTFISELAKQYILESIEEFEKRIMLKNGAKDIYITKIDETINIRIIYMIKYSNLPLQSINILYNVNKNE